MIFLECIGSRAYLSAKVLLKNGKKPCKFYAYRVLCLRERGAVQNLVSEDPQRKIMG